MDDPVEVISPTLVTMGHHLGQRLMIDTCCIIVISFRCSADCAPQTTSCRPPAISIFGFNIHHRDSVLS